jgi:molybdenum cofactor cytidylyltransferase
MPNPLTITESSSMPAKACVGLLLAAGHGRRFAAMAPGQDKLLAPLTPLRPGWSVAQAAATALCAATGRTIAVTRADQAALRTLLASAGCEVLVVGPDANGMGDSLAAAARHLLNTAVPGEQTCLIALADMPWLRHDTCQHVAAAALEHSIVVPTWQGRRGHPVAFSRVLWPELATLSGDTGARSLLARHPVTELAVDDAGVLADVDTPQDLHPSVDGRSRP